MNNSTAPIYVIPLQLPFCPPSVQQGHLVLKFHHEALPVNPNEPIVVLEYRRISVQELLRPELAFLEAPTSLTSSPPAPLVPEPISENDELRLWEPEEKDEKWEAIKRYFNGEDEEEDDQPPLLAEELQGSPYEGEDGEILQSHLKVEPYYPDPFDEEDPEMTAYLDQFRFKRPFPVPSTEQGAKINGL